MSYSNAISPLPQRTLVKGQELNKFLCFLLANKNYGINILSVKEIIEHTEITPVPMMPDFFLGAINLRGRMVPVIDIACRLGMAPGEIHRRSCIVITEILGAQGGATEIGILVDAVSRVADIPPEQIEAAPSCGEELRLDFIHGMGKVNDKFVILLEIEKILSMKDLKMIQQVELNAPPLNRANEEAVATNPQTDSHQADNQDTFQGDQNA